MSEFDILLTYLLFSFQKEGILLLYKVPRVDIGICRSNILAGSYVCMDASMYTVMLSNNNVPDNQTSYLVSNRIIIDIPCTKNSTKYIPGRYPEHTYQKEI